MSIFFHEIFPDVGKMIRHPITTMAVRIPPEESVSTVATKSPAATNNPKRLINTRGIHIAKVGPAHVGFPIKAITGSAIDLVGSLVTGSRATVIGSRPNH